MIYLKKRILDKIQLNYINLEKKNFLTFFNIQTSRFKRIKKVTKLLRLGCLRMIKSESISGVTFNRIQRSVLFISYY